MRRSSARKRRESNNAIKATFFIVLIVAILGGGIWWVVKPQTGLIDETSLCPLDHKKQVRPKGHIVLLVDKTDVLGFIQNKAFVEYLDEFINGKKVPEGYLLSVFVLGHDYRETPDPIFQKCNPGDGSNINTLVASPERYNKLFTQKYQAVLKTLPRQLTAEKSSESSPIFEMLQMVSLNLQTNDVKGPRALFIVSDMLQNTNDISLFNKSSIDYELFKNSPRFTSLSADLKDVDIQVNYLLVRPDLQTMRLNNFWENYFEDMGGRLVKVDKIMGSK